MAAGAPRGPELRRRRRSPREDAGRCRAATPAPASARRAAATTSRENAPINFGAARRGRVGHPARAPGDHARPSSAAPRTSTSSPRRTRCGSATASTACSRRRRPSRRRGPGGHLAHQDPLRPRHRRAPHPAGRPHLDWRSTDKPIDLRVATLPAHTARRSSCASWTRARRMIELEQLGMLPQALERFTQGLRPVARRRARHRPDRLGQVDLALRRAQPAQHGREEHHHDRGPGRVPARGHHPGPGQQQGGPDVRLRPALDDARRPGHHHGRRDPRPRDGADRHRGGADRPPRALARCTPTTRRARSPA